MPPLPGRRFALAGGVVAVEGTGPAVNLMARHLATAGEDGETWITIDVADGVDRAHGSVISGRGGAAVVVDGDVVHVRWEPGLRTMRPLLAAAHLAAARRGGLVLEGAAFAWDERVVVVHGPSGAGKTGALLGAVEAGATPVAADWCWVERDSGAVWPTSQPVRVRPHHRRSPALAGALSPLERVRLAVGAVLPAPLARRAFVDVPIAVLGRGASGRGTLRGVVVLGTGPAPERPAAADVVRVDAPWAVADVVRAAIDLASRGRIDP